ncbi:MAG TPA: hypothetical protein VMX16_01660 [Terriglobia bacterium]|nr:hypothetical protein [Terriglobia bacterium]
MRIDRSLFFRAALPMLVALAIGPAPGVAHLSQNPNPPEIVIPKPPPLPGDFTDQRPKNQGPKAPQFDPAKARKDAQQLATLAQKVPSQVDQLSKSQLPKDLLQNLKQIQKLAKRLRSEIPH